MSKQLSFFMTCLLFLCRTSFAQQEIFLYPHLQTPAANEKVLRQVSSPSLVKFLPSSGMAGGKAVIICPGGGYRALMMDYEGEDIAREFNKSGIAAFVLKYRLPDREKDIDQSSWPLQDAQTAIKTVRKHAKEWQIDPGKIGIMGFSAGGHLAATAGTHYAKPVIADTEGISVRPDFMILVYPVISFRKQYGNTGTRNQLLGEVQTMEKIDFYSSELHVDSTTPPAILIHGSNDSSVNPANSIMFYETLIQNGIQAELHIYADGKHGFPKNPPFEEWFGRCLYWLKGF